MEDVGIESLIKEHKAKFGFNPVFTGESYWEAPEEIIKKLIDSIDNDKPYQERDVNLGVLI